LSSYIVISFPDDYNLKSMLKKESRRTGKTASKIIREAFDEYRKARNVGSLDEYSDLDPSPLLNLPENNDGIGSLSKALVRRVGWEKGHDIAENLQDIAHMIRDEALNAAPSTHVVRGGSPGVQ